MTDGATEKATRSRLSDSGLSVKARINGKSVISIAKT